VSIGSLAIVEEWLDAVNRGDGVRLEQLTHDEVEIVGPRGSGRADRRVLSEWLTRAGFSAEPLRWFGGGRRPRRCRAGRSVGRRCDRRGAGARTRGIAVPRRPDPHRQVRAA